MINSIENKNISILINHKLSSDNDRNWLYMKKRYKSLMPNAEICIGDYPKGGYNKSTAINNAAKNATRDIFIIADSNIAFNIECIRKGLDNLKQYPLIIPFGDLIYIDEQSTKNIRKLTPSSYIRDMHFTAYKRLPMPIGYIFIVPRINFEAIGGFDENITEWDEENTDFVNRIMDRFGDYERLNKYPIWSLYYEKINYPLYMKGINIERILKKKYSLGGISWDVRI